MPAPTDIAHVQQNIATRKLLSTLIGLLTLRDPDLLDELDEIFAETEFTEDEGGALTAEVWQLIRDELASARRIAAGFTTERDVE